MEIDSTIAANIQSRFDQRSAVLDEALSFLAGESMRNAIDQLHTNERDARLSLNRLLTARYGASPLSIEVRNRTNSLLSYVGSRIPTRIQRINSVRGAGTREIVRDAHRMFLAAQIAIDQGEDSVFIRAAIPIEERYPVHNRFIRSAGFSQDISDEFGVELQYLSDATEGWLDGRNYVFPLMTGVRDTLLHVSILKANPASYAQFIRDAFDDVRSFLSLILTFIVLVAFSRAMRFPIQSGIVACILLVSFIWIVRVAWYFLGVADFIFPQAALDPILYASPFGYGIASSLGELTLSTIAVSLSVFVLRRSLQRGIGQWTPSRVQSILLAGGVLLAVPFVVRTYAVIIRSFVLDSSFQYYDVGSIFEQPFYWLMLTNAGLVTFAFILLLIILITILRRVDDCHRLGSRQFIVSLIIAGVASSLLVLLADVDWILPQWTYLACCAILIACVLMMRFAHQWHLASILTRSLLLSLASLSAFLPCLHHSMSERIHDAASLRAQQQSRSRHSWNAFLLTESLQQIHSHMQSANLRLRDRPFTETDAFNLWAQSSLSREPVSASIALFDERQQPQSTFAVGIPPSDARFDWMPALPNDSTFTTTYSSASGRQPVQYLAGVTHITGSNGTPDSYAAVLIANEEFSLDTRQRTDILRNANPEATTIPETDFIVTRIHDGNTLASNDATVPVGMAIDRSTLRALTASAEGVWSTLIVGEEARPTFFVASSDSGADVVAVSLPTADRASVMYRIVRFALIFFVISLVVLVLVDTRRVVQFIRAPSIRFVTKLRLVFLLLAIVPAVLLLRSSYSNTREFIQSTWKRQLVDALPILDGNIRQYIDTTLTTESVRKTVTNATCVEIAEYTGIELNLYLADSLHATSKPELYATSLLDSRLNAHAFREIALKGSDFFIGEERIGNASYLVGYKAFRDADGKTIAVVSSPTLFEGNSIEREYVRSNAQLFLWSFIVLFLVILGSVAFANQIAKPVQRLTRATTDIADGNIDQEIATKRSDEFGSLIRAFNEMSKRLVKSRDDLARAQRELAWNEMAKQVVHEIRNPLTPMKLAAQHLRTAHRDRAENLDAIIERTTDVIIEQIDALSRIANVFAMYARMPERTSERLALAPLLRAAAALFSGESRIAFSWDIEDDSIAVTTDQNEMRRCIVNVLRNAVQSIESLGTIRVVLSRRDNRAVIVIADHGHGIAPEILPRIFEPNFSTKTDGMGLGLSIVKKIIDDSGGTISVESEINRGTTVRIELPLAGESETR